MSITIKGLANLGEAMAKLKAEGTASMARALKRASEELLDASRAESQRLAEVLDGEIIGFDPASKDGDRTVVFMMGRRAGKTLFCEVAADAIRFNEREENEVEGGSHEIVEPLRLPLKAEEV